jgi:hypothetical protein
MGKALRELIFERESDVGVSPTNSDSGAWRRPGAARAESELAPERIDERLLHIVRELHARSSRSTASMGEPDRETDCSRGRASAPRNLHGPLSTRR